MKTKAEILKEFKESLEDSPEVTDIVFKRLLLELLIDLRDATGIAKIRDLENCWSPDRITH